MLRNNILISTIVLSGCCTTPPGIKTELQLVEIPVVIPCRVKVPAPPQFNFDQLTVDNDIFVKGRALLADRQLHLGYENELLAALSSCIK